MPNRHSFGIGRHRDEVLRHGVVTGGAAQTVEEPVPRRRGVGQRLERRERLRADDEQRRLGVQVMRGRVQVHRVDVGNEATGQARLGVVGQRQRGHGGAEVRAADPDVDDRGDPLARRPGPLAVPDAVGEVTHLAQDALHVADDVLAVDVQGTAGRHAQRHVQDGAILGRVDVLTGEHGVAVLLHLGDASQVEEQAQRLVRRPLLRVVDDEVGPPGRHAVRPLGIVREEPAQMPRRDLVVVRRQRRPLRCRGEVHGRQSTARHAPVRPR
jgi:hypothetical protein